MNDLLDRKVMALRMQKKLLFLLLLTSLALSACGSSQKDYSNATPLSSIKSRVTVKELWAEPTGDVPDNAHAQLPVIVDGDKVYAANRRGGVIVRSAQDGATVWKVSLNEMLTGGPGVGGDMVIVATREAELIALDKSNGTERWRQRISSEMLATPVITGKLVIAQTIDGRISAHKISTGEKVWSYGRSIPKLTLRGTSTPIVVGKALLAGFSDGHLISLDLATGELLWETTIAVPHGRTDLERLVDIDGLFQAEDGTVYVSSYQGRVAAVSVADGNVLWARDISSYTGLTVDGNQIFITDANSQVWALDGHTGATLWRQDKLLGREISAPAVLDSTVVVADYDGFVHWLSRDDGSFVARENLGKVWSKLNYVWEDEDQPDHVRRSVSVAPLVAAGTLYVRDNAGGLAAFKLSN